ncbi:ninjurin-1-like [Mytilus californianus]|uniref:ninjurin-1-like n=1 Tax=Mytilus californianus TaxID=6549 RepID=UPI0022470B58|nr:ninjurin-1-like [Mytilus californianus]
MATSIHESIPLKQVDDGGYQSELHSRNSSIDNNSTKVEMKPPPEGKDEEESPRTLIEDETESSSNTSVSNKFQSRRDVTKGLYDVALLMANVSQLRSVLDSTDNKYYMALVGLLIASISFHLISAFLLYALLIVEKQAQNKRQHANENKTKSQSTVNQTSSNVSAKSAVCTNCFADIPSCCCWKIYKIDIVATVCVIAVTILNVFITAFGSSIKS